MHGKIRGLAEETVSNNIFNLNAVSELGYQTLLGFEEKRHKLTGQRFSKSRAPGRRLTMVVFTAFVTRTVLAENTCFWRLERWLSR